MTDDVVADEESKPVSDRRKTWRKAVRDGIRPSSSTPEFAKYFENVVKTSKRREEAVKRMGYANPSIIYHHMKRLGIEAPIEWRLKPYVGSKRRQRVPQEIISTVEGRFWVAALIQGEGCIRVHYSKRSHLTAVELVTVMGDPAPIFTLSDYVGASRRLKPKLNNNGNPMWLSVVGGLRAYRVLQEIRPFLLGQKLREAERALEFFAPYGYRRGHHGGYDVWPRSEFPLRKPGNPHTSPGERKHI